MSELKRVIEEMSDKPGFAEVSQVIQEGTNRGSDLLYIPEGDATLYLEELFEMSVAFYGLDREEDGVKHWLHYLKVSEQFGLPAPDKHGEVLHFLGYAAEQQAHYNQAEDWYRSYLEFAGQRLTEAEVSKAHHKLGKALLYNSNYAPAMEHLLAALDLPDGLGNENWVDCMSALAGIHVRLGNTSHAESLFSEIEQAVEKNKELEANKASIYNIMAIANQDIRQYKRAILYLKRAIDLERDRYDKSESMLTYINNLAQAYHENRQYDKAMAELDKAMELSGEIVDPDHLRNSEIYNNYGITLLAQYKYEEATAYFDKSKQILERYEGHEQKLASWHVNHGVLYFEQGRYEDSKENLELGRQLMQKILPEVHQEHVNLLLHQASTYEALGETQEVFSRFQEARIIFRGLLEKQFSSMSQEEKQQFYLEIFHYYELFISFVVRQIQVDSTEEMLRLCYDLVTESKSFLLDESLLFHSTGRSHESQAIKATFNRLNELKASFPQKVLEDSDSYQQVVSEIRLLEKQLADQVPLPTGQSLDSLMDCLEEDEILIQSFRMDYYDQGQYGGILYMFLIITSTAIHVTGEGKDEIFERQDFAYYLNHLGKAKSDQKSYDTYWVPLEEYAEGPIKKVWFVPDGVYNRISLHTLYNARKDKYLDEQLDISYLSSIAHFVNERQAAISSPIESVVVCYPMDDPGHDGFLPAGAEELAMIKATFDQHLLSPLIGPQSNSIDFIRIKSPSILHVITHGYFYEYDSVKEEDDWVVNDFRSFDLEEPVSDQPLFNSGLLMHDEALSAFSVSTMDLKDTELAVLSACESALGEQVHGAGNHGLIRAFQIAGVKRVIAAMWKVSDKATAYFMGKFYQQLVKHNNYAESLAYARQQTRIQFPEPGDWGGFLIFH